MDTKNTAQAEHTASSALKATIEEAFERRAEINAKNVDAKVSQAVSDVIDGLDNGSLRVAEKQAGQWQVNEWVKKE